MGRGSVRYRDLTLPPRRFRLCGADFSDDQYFLDSAEREAERLAEFCGLTGESSLLDVGCGPGRLPIGILSHLGEIKNYHGLDVDSKSIKWCLRHINKEHPAFQFARINVRNTRYNPDGQRLDNHFEFPFEDGEFDIIYLYSVFSHMVREDVEAYLSEFQRLLSEAGRIFLTGFLEENAPQMTVNPKGYRRAWKGALHCVRYDKSFFEALLKKHGFAVERFDYETETDGQSGVYARRVSS